MGKRNIFEIGGGMDFLHSHWIVRNALKPQNLVVTHDKAVKLMDLGQK